MNCLYRGGVVRKLAVIHCSDLSQNGETHIPPLFRLLLFKDTFYVTIMLSLHVWEGCRSGNPVL